MSEDVNLNEKGVAPPTEGSAYDEIMAQQKMSVEELKEHMTGPVIAILLHAIILPCVIGMVISEPAEQQPDIIVAKEEVILEPPPPPPPPPDIPPPDNVVPDDKPFDRPVVEDQTEVTTEDVEIPAEVMLDAPVNPFVIPPNNSRRVIGSASPFGRKGGGKGGNGGFGNGMSGLKGVFYDIKQNANGSPNEWAQNIANEDRFSTTILKPFVRGGMKTSDWNAKFYQSPTNLYASSIYIPRCRADEAPKAFECADKVQPSRWVCHYSGRVLAPITGTFRFAGAGDDTLVVAINKKVILDYGWTQSSLGFNTARNLRDWSAAMRRDPNAPKDKIRQLDEAGVYTKPVEFYKYQNTPEWNNSLGGIPLSDSFTVTKGEVLDIDIMISEIPGGWVGFALVIENVDKVGEYERDPQFGSPILPLFRTSSALPPVQEGLQAVPFSTNGEIWRVVSDKYDPKKAAETAPVKNEDLIKF